MFTSILFLHSAAFLVHIILANLVNRTVSINWKAKIVKRLSSAYIHYSARTLMLLCLSRVPNILLSGLLYIRHSLVHGDDNF
jgi:hypothetical protein